MHAVVDSGGVYGSVLHYGMVIFLVDGAFLIFIHLWSKGRLDMDEEPKLRMMREDDEQSDEDATQ